jgi:hypothetical protein
MAPRRKYATAPPGGREIKMRLPEDIATRIESKAKAEGRPMNRVVINELALIPHYERLRDLNTAVQDMEIILARYGARITSHDLGEGLLQAVDAVLAAEGGAQQAAIDRLRVVRRSMLTHERIEAGKRGKGKE